MKKYKLRCSSKKLLADTVTPVNIYLKLRDRFPNSLLLESSDYHGNENSLSFICCNSIAHFKAGKGEIEEKYPDNSIERYPIDSTTDMPSQIESFAESFEVEEQPFNFPHGGLFGYITYDAVRFFEDIQLSNSNEDFNIPDIQYHVFQHVIVINHFKHELYIFEYTYEDDKAKSGIAEIEDLIRNKNFPTYPFHTDGPEESNFTDEGFLRILKKGKEHIQRGDVFQVVLSRRFSQRFTGDEFNVYRALRSVNPSPYLFYFDYGDFKIFGSSPEAQIVVESRTASIYPIAGTFRRTGDDEADLKLAEQLREDPKENAEHVMLVDLARNDLSRNGKEVKVETYKEIQYYSHVIHLVSKVSATLNNDTSILKVVADTFPAGTLSGAPKHKAMQLIDQYEHTARGFYAGCVGLMSFNGDFNHAIMIRSFLSKDNTLYYQAGAGIVTDSIVENELREVNNKLLALKKAIEMAKDI